MAIKSTLNTNGYPEFAENQCIPICNDYSITQKEQTSNILIILQVDL